MTPEIRPADHNQAKELMRRIRDRRWVTGADILQHGEDLTALKDILGHDRFVETIRRELGLSARNADACITAYWEFRRYKEVAGVLPAESLLLLCQRATPPSLRETVRKYWESGKRLEPHQILAWVTTAKQAEAEAAREAKLSIERYRESAWRPRTERARHKRKLARDRAFDAAKVALRMLERDQRIAVGQFLAHATPQECKVLAYQVTNDPR